HLEDDITAVGNQTHIAIAARFRGWTLGAWAARTAFAAGFAAGAGTFRAELLTQIDLLSLRTQPEIKDAFILGPGTGARGGRVMRLRPRCFAEREVGIAS